MIRGNKSPNRHLINKTTALESMKGGWHLRQTGWNDWMIVEGLNDGHGTSAGVKQQSVQGIMNSGEVVERDLSGDTVYIHESQIKEFKRLRKLRASSGIR